MGRRKGVITGNGKRVLNPADAERRRDKKQDAKRNAKARATSRKLMDLADTPEAIEAELKKLVSSGEQDQRTKQKIQLLSNLRMKNAREREKKEQEEHAALQAHTVGNKQGEDRDDDDEDRDSDWEDRVPLPPSVPPPPPGIPPPPGAPPGMMMPGMAPMPMPGMPGLPGHMPGQVPPVVPGKAGPQLPLPPVQKPAPKASQSQPAAITTAPTFTAPSHLSHKLLGMVPPALLKKQSAAVSKKTSTIITSALVDSETAAKDPKALAAAQAPLAVPKMNRRSTMISGQVKNILSDLTPDVAIQDDEVDPEFEKRLLAKGRKIEAEAKQRRPLPPPPSAGKWGSAPAAVPNKPPPPPPKKESTPDAAYADFAAEMAALGAL